MGVLTTCTNEIKKNLGNLRFVCAVTMRSAACWDVTPSGLA